MPPSSVNSCCSCSFNGASLPSMRQRRQVEVAGGKHIGGPPLSLSVVASPDSRAGEKKGGGVARAEPAFQAEMGEQNGGAGEGERERRRAGGREQKERERKRREEVNRMIASKKAISVIPREEAAKAVIEKKRGRTNSKKLLPRTVLEALHERITAFRWESALKDLQLKSEVS